MVPPVLRTLMANPVAHSEWLQLGYLPDVQIQTFRSVVSDVHRLS